MTALRPVHDVAYAREPPLGAVRKVAIVGVLALVNSAGYWWLNHNLRAPEQLPLTALDRATPFLPWTMWPYLALFVSDVILPLALRNRRVFHDVVFAYVIAILSNVVIWNLIPTTYPRPPPPSGSSITDAAFRIMVSLDTPNVCFPSGHITIPAVGCWGLVREHPRLRGAVWTTFALLSLTVLTTKQHYAVDLLGGFGTALFGIAVVARLRRRARPVPGGVSRVELDGGEPDR
jgi:membrane-associated phospholipid phosphatase